MQVYIYCADTYCPECIANQLAAEGKIPVGSVAADPQTAIADAIIAAGYASEREYDSDELPKGPYEDGGGEADSPQHCAACLAFLQNPLTTDGHQYVADIIAEVLSGHGVNSGITTIQEWARFYEAEIHVYNTQANVR